jgi:hypothetical protein
MLVMAAEAAKSISPTPDDITGFFFKEAEFSNAIVIREHDSKGIEVTTSVRKLQRPFENDSTWLSVTLHTCTPEGTWHANFHCTLKAVYEGTITEVDRGNEEKQERIRVSKAYEDAVVACTRPIEAKAFYDYYSDHGMRYGPSFQVLDNILWDGKDTSVAQLRYTDPSASDSLVHPSLIDATCQMYWIGPTVGFTKTIPTEIPRRLRNTWISASGWSQQRTEPIRVHLTSQFKQGSANLLSTTVALDANLQPLMIMESLESVPAASVARENAEKGKLCYGLDWIPQLDLLDLPALHAICAANFVPQDETAAEDYFTELSSALCNSMSDILGQKETFKSVIPEAYIKWIENQQAASPKNSLRQNGRTDETIINQPHALDTRWQLFTYIANQLNLSTAGKFDVNNMDVAPELVRKFQDTTIANLCDTRFVQYVELAAHQNPNLRVLELGAGSGEMAKHVLSVLTNIEDRNGGSSFDQYLCTDASPTSLDSARKRLESVSSKVQFKQIDLQKENQLSDIDAGSFDLVIATNVSHSSPDEV